MKEPINSRVERGSAEPTRCELLISYICGLVIQRQVVDLLYSAENPGGDRLVVGRAGRRDPLPGSIAALLTMLAGGQLENK